MRYQNNELRRVASIDDPAQKKIFSYDMLGRVKKEIRVIYNTVTRDNIPLDGDTFITSFEHDLLGRKRTIYYPEDPITHVSISARYEYSSMGITAIEVYNPAGKKNIISGVLYNEFGQMTRVARGNKTVTSYTYDIKGRLSNLTTTTSVNGETRKIQDVNYSFKVDNSISSLINTPDIDTSGVHASSIAYNYKYDGLNRLVGASGSYSRDSVISREYEHGYSYSRNGNLMQKTMGSSVYNASGGIAQSSRDSWLYTYSNHAAVSIETNAGANCFDMEYDAVGNMISQTSPGPLNPASAPLSTPPGGDLTSITKKMAYDSYNRIRRVEDADNNPVGEYWYDDQGFRVRKIAKRTSPLNPPGGDLDGRMVEVMYPSMYFGIERQRDSSGALINDPDITTKYAVNNIYLDGVRIAAVIPSGDAQYYLTDQVDSVKVVVNDSGLPVSRMEYLPYGETWFEEGNTNNAPKYNSQELDKETGYYFYNARHYDPQVSRFVTADTVVDGEYSTQGWNRYSYCSNNPIEYKDPTGHEAKGDYLTEAAVNYAKGLQELKDHAVKYANELKQLRDFAVNYATVKELEAKINKATGDKIDLTKGFHVVMLENNTKTPHGERGSDKLMANYYIIDEGDIKLIGYGSSKASTVKGKGVNPNNNLDPGTYEIHGETGNGFNFRYMRLFKNKEMMEKYYSESGEGNYNPNGEQYTAVSSSKGSQKKLLLHPPNPESSDWSGGQGCQLLEGFSRWSKNDYTESNWKKLEGQYHLIDMSKDK